jgi:hypothetical protein
VAVIVTDAVGQVGDGDRVEVIDRDRDPVPPSSPTSTAVPSIVSGRS